LSSGTSVFIGLGSNIGDGIANIMEAWQYLAGHTAISPLRLSHPYATSPVDMESEHWFVNAVGELSTGLTATALLQEMLALEHKMGRRRERGRDRVIDLDILLYDDQLMEDAQLIVPHPEMIRRLFVMVPLAEIAPEKRHPLYNRTMQSLLDDLAHSEQQIRPLAWPVEGF